MLTDKDRTAIVIVHGMGEQLPVETLAQFAKSALPQHEGSRWYFSRADTVSSSFEARCYRAYRRPFHGPPEKLVHGNVDLYEYHWSYLMTGNRVTDVVKPALRLLLRLPWRVPSGLRVLWALIWIVAISLITLAVVYRDPIADWSTTTLQRTIGIAAVVLAIGTFLARALLKGAGAVVGRTFVDVVRYLDRSPRSYTVRKDIRAGLVDLLAELHAAQRYSRVVVVAHSLGGFIAYDALTSLWPTMNRTHTCEPRDSKFRIPHLATLTEQAKQLQDHPTDEALLDDEQSAELHAFRATQLDLWKDLRLRGNPWLVTDFITLGTPMYFADILLSSKRSEFTRLTRISELPMCPPRPGTQTVEGDTMPIKDRDTYSHVNQNIEVLNHDALFAVVRWTNLYFRPAAGFFGDWFGGPLRPLYGLGIQDQPLTGNRPKRFMPGLAHSYYFRYPEQLDSDDAARQLQRHINFRLEAEDDDWPDLVKAP